MEYKIQQLRLMLDAEQSQPDREKYGAHITHWSGRAKPVNIDEEAIQLLIDHYAARMQRPDPIKWYDKPLTNPSISDK